MKEQTNIKFQASMLAIFIGSLLLFGLIYFAVDRISGARTNEAQKKRGLVQALPRHEAAVIPPIKSKQEAQENPSISVIQAIASLSEDELKKEFASLGERLKSENLFNKLERGELDEHNKAQAKAQIERYTLLGLEGTRRQYLPLEPELKDAVYAHRDSLKDIRKLIDRY